MNNEIPIYKEINYKRHHEAERIYLPDTPKRNTSQNFFLPYFFVELHINLWNRPGVVLYKS